MRAKSIKLLTVLLLIAFSAAIFTGCKEESLVSQETVSQDPILQEVFEEYSKIIEQQTIDDLRLKIYIEDETFFNWKFWRTADELIGSSHTSMIEIDSSKLNAHKDALRLLDPNQLTRVEYDSQLRASLCFLFERESDNSKVLEIVFSGIDRDNEFNIVFINDVKVEYNDCFRDFIKPFVSSQAMAKIEAQLPGNQPDMMLTDRL